DPSAGLTACLLLTAQGVMFALIVGVRAWRLSRLAAADLDESGYLRTSGPVSIRRLGSLALLHFAERSFLVETSVAARIASHGARQPWAQVDYTRHGHFVLDLRDACGASLYRAPGLSDIGA